ncbi:DUF4229 domain-containing protein [Leucobacter chromiiresistens]
MNNPRTAWIVYIVLRLLFFAVPFAVLYAIGLTPWIAAVFAALIGVALSVIFLARTRSTASESIYEWRNRRRTADDIVEDEAVDAGAAGGAGASAGAGAAGAAGASAGAGAAGAAPHAEPSALPQTSAPDAETRTASASDRRSADS